MQFRDTKWAIIGFGLTGRAGLDFLHRNGAEVVVYDAKSDIDISAFADKKDLMKHTTFRLGESGPQTVTDLNGILISPGVHLDLPFILEAQKLNIPIFNDITLFLKLWANRSKIIGVTGSNGKSTTVSLLEHVFKDIEVPVFLGGNIGRSPLDIFGTSLENQNPIIVLELSSYMLEMFGDGYYVDIAVITNLTDNHLDRYHGRMDGYASAKSSIAKLGHTMSILNIDDAGTRKYILPILSDGHILPVSLEQGINDFPKDIVALGDSGPAVRISNKVIYHFSDSDRRKIQGQHNLYNISFVIGVLASMHDFDIDWKKVDESLRNFPGLEHRIEFVRELDGVRYINDSKSTSADALIKALETLANDKNVVLICGGQDKGSSISSIKDAVNLYVKKAILVPGDILEKFEKIFKENLIPIYYTSSLEEAVQVSHSISEKGDIVLLSPGASSRNSFKNFEERGTAFKKFVNQIQTK